MSALHSTLVVLALGLAALTAIAARPEPPLARDEVAASQLAEWLRARRPDLRVVDVRPMGASSRERLPGAEPFEEFVAEASATVVVYGEDVLDAAPALPGRAAQVLRLRGGVAAWNRDVLFPTIRRDAPPRQQRAFAARAQLSRYFGGSPRVLDPGAQADRPRSRRGC